jgi:hypothetical protein
MRNPMDEIREDIRRLHLAHARGDIKEKTFQRLLAQRTTDLYRALVEGALAPGERILKEHHVVEAHTRLTESVLREPEQTATSLFLTQRRLLRVRSSIRPKQPITADHRDSTIVDELPLAKIRSLRNGFRIRPGEITAGLVMATVALVFWQWLEVTGVILLGLGLLGALHGLLMPTRWVEISTEPTLKEPFRILAPTKKSGKELIRMIRMNLKTEEKAILAKV